MSVQDCQWLVKISQISCMLPAFFPEHACYGGRKFILRCHKEIKKCGVDLCILLNESNREEWHFCSISDAFDQMNMSSTIQGYHLWPKT
jgi:hypothetical protein